MTSAAPTEGLLHVEALGATIAIEVPDHRLRPAVEHAWSACRTTPVQGCPVAAAPELSPEAGADHVAQALQSLTQLVTRAAILARAGELMMFHASALCDQRSGATIAMVAPGGTGKTTLVRTLGPGRGYVTDETTGVAADGSISTYCKPLSVRRPDVGQPKDEVAPSDLGLHRPQVRPWLAGMVILRRDREAGEPVVVEEVDVLDALVLLAPETSSLASFDRPLHRLADLVQSVGGLRRVRYHDAADVEPVVREVLGRSR
ncbi:hypothetical protein LJR027_002964 [Terrabacter sp. LjRoot27]|uniref:hypothetical protein n=1 Tax=Terrabacter sp. LjRoot27 TaxID=3342306 RepID=UPI003ECEF399